MKLEDISEIYALVSSGVESIPARQEAIALRRSAFKKALGTEIIKVAFDTRRVDQEKEYISRRGLQNYNRSDEFITQANVNKIRSLKKLKDVLESLKSQFVGDKGWQDSYCRVLLDTIDKALRTDQKDGDFTDAQPGVGSFDYIEEMLFVRYRLELMNVAGMSESTLKAELIKKDPELKNPDINDLISIDKSDVRKESYDTLLEKLFGGVRATKDNPEVERTVTITIKDKFVE